MDEPKLKFEYNPNKSSCTSLFKVIYQHTTILEFILYVIGILSAIAEGYFYQHIINMLGEMLDDLYLPENILDTVNKNVSKKFYYYGALAFLAQFLMFFLLEYVSFNIIGRIKAVYLRILFSLNQSFYDNLPLAKNELITEIEREILTIRSAIGINFGNIFMDATIFVYGISDGFHMHAKSALLMSYYIPLWILCAILFLILMKKEEEKKKKMYNEIGGYLSDTIKNIKEVASFSNFDYEREIFNKKIQELKEIFRDYPWKTALLDAITCFLVSASMTYRLGILGYQFYQVLINKKTYDIQSFVVSTELFCMGGAQIIDIIPYIRRYMQCINIFSFYENIKQYYIYYANVKDQWNELIFKDERYFKKGKKLNIEEPENQTLKTIKNKIKGKITFNNVCFSYYGKEAQDNLDSSKLGKEKIEYVLKDFNMIIKENEMTAIYGESGAGKSTIVKLIVKIYELEEGNGQILIDDFLNINNLSNNSKGNNINNEVFDLNTYRKLIGYVPQQAVLSNCSIRENIKFGRENISDCQIWNTLGELGFDDFIKILDKKLDYIVGSKGGKLSGGQIQKIAIARALVGQPKILILDEAASSLDSKSENSLNKAIDSLKGKMTIILITHKIKDLKRADNIIMMKSSGIIIESGKKAELLEKKGVYYNVLKEVGEENENLGHLSNEKKKEYFLEDGYNKYSTIIKKPSSQIYSKSSPNETNIDDSLNVLNNELIKNTINLKNYSEELDSKKITPSNAFDEEENQEEAGSSITNFIKGMTPYKKLFFIGLFLFLAKGGVDSAIGYLFGDGEGIIFLQTKGNALKKKIKKYLLILGTLSLIKAILGFFGRFLLEILGEYLSEKYKISTFSMILRMHMGFFDKNINSPGKLSERIIFRTNAINGVIFSFLSLIFEIIGKSIGALIIGFIETWQMPVMTVIALIIILSLDVGFFIFSRKKEIILKKSIYGEILSDNLNNMIPIYAYNAKDFWIKQFLEENYSIRKKIVLYDFLISLFYSLSIFTLYIFDGIFCYVTTKLYVNGTLSLNSVMGRMGTLEAVVQMLSYSIKNIRLMSNMSESIADLDKLEKLKTEIDPENDPGIIEESFYSNLTGKIEFNNVSFAYPSNKSSTILKNVNFIINPGDKIGIIGNSGCGKSTISQLIERFYDINGGNILIDNYCLKDLNLSKLRKKIGYVRQEPVIFNRTNYENILYGKLDSTEEEVLEAAKSCKIDNKLNHETTKSESEKKEICLGNVKNEGLSGGEKQRICLARVILKKPQILILDESTSALDKETEEQIQGSIEHMINQLKCTLIIISHKYNDLKSCSNCILIKDGIISKIGKPNEFKNFLNS